MTDVTWAPVPEFVGYEISDRGSIRRITPRGTKMIRPGRNNSGHLVVGLYKSDGSRHKRYVHRLVLLAFVGEPEPGQVGCHWDDVPSNNDIGNLRWDTAAANTADAIRNGRIRARAA